MIERSPTLKRVLGSDLCTGCGLCAGVSDGAIAMALDARGFVRPVQSRAITASAEEAIATACPGATVAEWSDAAPQRDSYWGPWYESLTGYATDPEVRFAGASGGALSALAAHALETGLVEQVLHVEADPERPTGNRMRWSRTSDEIIVGAGSRYASSSPLAAIQQALDDGAKFAFIGKPCDVSALRRYALVDPRVDAQVPLVLSFFCGGLPGTRGADRILDALGLKEAELASFRYRGNGWPGLAVAETHAGEQRTMSYHDSWGGHLSKEVQFRCKICPDAVGAVADVACADAWYGGESGYPAFEEADGRSLLLTRTRVGSELVRSAAASRRIVVETLPVRDIELMQPSQAQRKRFVLARTAACRVAFRSIPKMKGLDVISAARRASAFDMARNFLGTLRRLVLPKAEPAKTAVRS